MWRKALLPIRLVIYYHLAYWAFSRFQGRKLFRPLVDPDAWHHPVEYARNLGYEAEAHLVTTEDEVVLELHRIKARVDATTHSTTRVPVVLQHGLYSSSFNWMANLPNQSLAFVLADAGYDVWLANSRGNTFSKRSASTKSDFWSFTKDDLALIDTPATIDYVLGATGSKFVHFIGHSDGGFILMALLSERPEYAKKMGLGVALAPVLKATYAVKRVKYLHNFFEIFCFLPSFEMMSIERFPVNLVLNPVVCGFLPRMCSWIYQGFGGCHHSHVNVTRAAVYAGGIPAGTSFANFRQITQNFVHDRFGKFDYGTEENLRRYKQKDPPQYNLARINGRLAVFFSEGDNDIYAGAAHNKWLMETLPKKSVVYSEALKDFSHSDFQLGINAKGILYDKMIKLMRDHEK